MVARFLFVCNYIYQESASPTEHASPLYKIGYNSELTPHAQTVSEQLNLTRATIPQVLTLQPIASNQSKEAKAKQKANRDRYIVACACRFDPSRHHHMHAALH